MSARVMLDKKQAQNLWNVCDIAESTGPVNKQGLIWVSCGPLR